MSDPVVSQADFQPPQVPPSVRLEEEYQPSSQPAIDSETLRGAAIREASHWEAAPPHKHCRTLDAALRQAAVTVESTISSLQGRPPDAANISDEARWLLQNHRLLRSALAGARNTLETSAELPQVRREDTRDSVPRVYAAAAGFLHAVNYAFNSRAFSLYISGIQEHGAFTTKELWALQSMVMLALVEKVATAAQTMVKTAPVPGPSRRAAGESDTSMAVLIASLRAVAETLSEQSIEEMSLIERVLGEDPAEAYRRMERASRNQYRSIISELAQHSPCSELDVARAAIGLSALAKTEWNTEPRRAERRSHVGYYLLDDRGRAVLEHQIGYRPPLLGQVRDAVRRKPDAFYLLGLELVTFAIMAFVLNGLRAEVPLIWALLLLLVPATESAIGAMNQLVAFLLPPRPLPKLDFSDGVPSEFTTMVAVPTLLTSDTQVTQIVRDLELRYLGNRDPNLHFALLTDFPDSPQPPGKRGTLVELCSKLIDDLNEKYRTQGGGRFYLFHRDLVYNPAESTWMGWERKRGKLLDFNNLLRGKFDSFPVKVGELSVLPSVRYVITLDADTQLPRDSARRLVGTLAHPLNRAVIDPSTNTVVEGYGILQPRIGISVRSANRSRLASVYSGQAGFDSYTRAVSDVYQDLTDEGSFTGKGIYEVDVFQRVLSDRFPLNTILSHDLIEGAYARAGLVSDVELVDDYPSHFSAYSRRKHRWVRGDWQIMRWLLPRVPDHSGHLVKNPTSVISKWKILDNLRRSLVEPATFVLLLAGWFFLTGGPARWTLAVLALLLIPAYLRLMLALVNLPRAAYLPGFLSDTAEAFVTDQVNVFLLLAFLAHQVLVTLDAIVRTVVRLTITRRRLLEWETAAEAEAGTDRRTPVDLYLEMTPLVSTVIASLLIVTRPAALPMAAPILVVWASAGLLSRWLNRPLRPGTSEITHDDEELLRNTALRTWRFFRSFSSEKNHWLIPDTVQDDPRIVIEHISPTNLGLLLNARIAAYEFGYIGLKELIAATEATLGSLRRMPRFRGHFFNWYHIVSLEPLEPRFVSTVDSGNLACALWALKQSFLQLGERPAFESNLGQGIRDHIRIILELATRLSSEPPMSPALERLRIEADRLAREETTDQVYEVRRALEELRARFTPEVRQFNEISYWIEEVESRLSVLRRRASDEGPYLRKCLQTVAAECDALVREMDFAFLYRSDRKVLSIGYDCSRHKLDPSCYDLLASEARTAAFVAVAKGDVPQESWFHMGRAMALCHGWRTLLSWSGTMFEYLMPVLWMKSYPRTLLDQTLRSAVNCQRRAAKNRRIPWGISESACSRKNELGHYFYHAFGLRELALRPDLFSGTVISPYSSCLALAVHTSAAVHNLRQMHDLGWQGTYGFYEAADYSASRSGESGPFDLVRSWMAHHQGMILLAICNLLEGSAIQNLFHAEPMVAATERLLQEKLARTVPVERTGL
ncbi:MAG TPA: glucoamylase family protein [Terriglobia bacterium]|nr:glucoamylase family protein [Terriglobia bacterium]